MIIILSNLIRVTVTDGEVDMPFHQYITHIIYTNS